MKIEASYDEPTDTLSFHLKGKMIAQNPNATAAALAGSIVTIGLVLANAIGYEAPADLGPALVTVITTAVLFLGKKKAA